MGNSLFRPLENTNAMLYGKRQNDEHKIRRNDHRSPFQRGQSTHTSLRCFSTYKQKLGVHGTSLNDFHRTRLTHSEPRKLAQVLSPSSELKLTRIQ